MKQIAKLGIALSILAGLSAFASAKDEIKVVNVRASRMLAMLATPNNPMNMTKLLDFRGSAESNALVPDGVRIHADDEKGVLEVYGTPDEVAQLQQYVSLFDVRPKEVHVTIDSNSPLDKYKNRAESNIRNNGSWETKDTFLNLNIKTEARINDDGTVTARITFGPQDHEKKVIVRLKNAKALEIVVDDVLTNEELKTTQNTDHRMVLGTPSPNATVLTLNFRIVEDK